MDKETSARVDSPASSRGSRHQTPDMTVGQAARHLSSKAITRAEQFKANVSAPKGKSPSDNVLDVIPRALVDVDDELFHVTCHVDSTLKEKIEKGEFVELERLLPKNHVDEESRLELVTKNGQTYFSPVQDRNTRITGIRKWEQAFRVYAAIYS